MDAIITLGDSERITVPLRNREGRPGTSADLTVRPGMIELSAGRPPGSCAVRSVVIDVVYLGTSTTTFPVQAAGATLTVFQQSSVSARLAERGDQMWLSWLPEDSCLLGANP